MYLSTITRHAVKKFLPFVKLRITAYFYSDVQRAFQNRKNIISFKMLVKFSLVLYTSILIEEWHIFCVHRECYCEQSYDPEAQTEMLICKCALSSITAIKVFQGSPRPSFPEVKKCTSNIF